MPKSLLKLLRIAIGLAFFVSVFNVSAQTELTENSANSAEQAVPLTAFIYPDENSEWLKVNSGDTLLAIAKQYKLADMNLESTLVALYRVNVKKFDGKNMNRIRAGKILKMPALSEYESISLSDAKQEIHVHATHWNAHRQNLAGLTPIKRTTENLIYSSR